MQRDGSPKSTQFWKCLVAGSLYLLPALSTARAAAPYAATQPASVISPTAAALNGTATPRGSATAWFEWGTNGSFGQATTPIDVGSGDNVARVSCLVSNLAAGGVYSFRLVVSNAAGATIGAEQRFTTGRGMMGWGQYFPGILTIPADLSNVVAIAAAGTDSCLALKNDGTVIAWGNQTNLTAGLSNLVAISGSSGACLALKGDGAVASLRGGLALPALSNVIGIAAGSQHGLALKSDGTISAWGASPHGETNVPAGLSNVVAVAAGESHSVALRNNGTVVAWGDSLVGQTNVPAGLTNVVSISAGPFQNLAIRRDGTVVGWGFPSITAGLSNVIATAAGIVPRMALKTDGTVTVWSDGASASGNFNSPFVVPADVRDVVAIASGGAFCLALCSPPVHAATQPAMRIRENSATLCGMATPNGFSSTAWFEWGTNGNLNFVTAPTNVGSGGAVMRVTAPISGLQHGGVYRYRLVVSNAMGVAFGAKQQFTTGQRFWSANADQRATDSAVSLALNGSSGYILQNDGVLVLDFGQSPVRSNVVAVAVGDIHALALKEDGTVSAWGNNTYGQINVPAGLSNVVAIAAGAKHSLALRADGTVVAWGYTNEAATSVPSGAYNVIAIGGGLHHSAALKNEGTVVVWGNNVLGASYQPFENAATIACGGPVTSILIGDGTVYYYVFGFQPYVPTGFSNIVAVANADTHILGLKADGSVIRWGNSYPPLPPGLNNVVTVAAGGNSEGFIYPDNPPAANAQSVSDGVNRDQVISLSGADADGDSLDFRIAALPAAGSLYLYDNSGGSVRGEAITDTNTVLSYLSSDGLVVFAPDTNGFGDPYASFSFTAFDGLVESAPATITIGVAPPQIPEITGFNFSAEGGSGFPTFEIDIAGDPFVTQSVWSSTNLVDWELLGAAVLTGAGLYQFVDDSVTNAPTRFYRISAP